jgi:putative transposase
MAKNAPERQPALLRRFYEKDLPVFITITPRNRQPAFQNPQNAEALLNLLYDLRNEKRLLILAFALMPDHFHLLFMPIPPENLSTIQHKLKRRSARIINWQSGRKGGFWDARSYDRVIRTEKHLIKTVECIHWNPVIARLVKMPEEHPYSSANPIWKTDLVSFLNQADF